MKVLVATVMMGHAMRMKSCLPILVILLVWLRTGHWWMETGDGVAVVGVNKAVLGRRRVSRTYHASIPHETVTVTPIPVNHPVASLSGVWAVMLWMW